VPPPPSQILNENSTNKNAKTSKLTRQEPHWHGSAEWGAHRTTILDGYIVMAGGFGFWGKWRLLLVKREGRGSFAFFHLI
jgi:hypothetical protein